MTNQRQTNSHVTVERRPGGQERKEKQYPTDEDVACWLDTDIHTIDEDTMANYQVIATAAADWTRNGGSSDPLKPGPTDFDDDIFDAKTEGYDEGYAACERDIAAWLREHQLETQRREPGGAWKAVHTSGCDIIAGMVERGAHRPGGAS